MLKNSHITLKHYTYKNSSFPFGTGAAVCVSCLRYLKFISPGIVRKVHFLSHYCVDVCADDSLNGCQRFHINRCKHLCDPFCYFISCAHYLILLMCVLVLTSHAVWIITYPYGMGAILCVSALTYCLVGGYVRAFLYASIGCTWDSPK